MKYCNTFLGGALLLATPLLLCDCARSSYGSASPLITLQSEYTTPRQQTTVVRPVTTQQQAATVSFSDSQKLQLPAAMQNGVAPMQNDQHLATMARRGDLVKIGTCDYYMLDHLTHSYPYLVPKAARLLDEIGWRVQRQVGSGCRVIVTSVLRTRQTVAQLQKTNGNAVQNSCHMHGTTIDISYSRFVHPASVSEAAVRQALRQALYELRSEGRCYVLQEFKQTCYHITVRN